MIGKAHNDANLPREFALNRIGAKSIQTSHYPRSEEVIDRADRQASDYYPPMLTAWSPMASLQ